MNRDEIRKELTLSYRDLVDYLLDKYGPATVDYFCTPLCRSRNRKVTRTAEGLLCHHICEDRGGNLSDSFSASLQPYEWQEKEQLVYCNYLEHLILHIKIAILRQRESLKTPQSIIDFFTTGGIFQICRDLNILYSGSQHILPWQRNCFAPIKENLEDYLALLKLILYYLDRQYIGIRSDTPHIQRGIICHYPDIDIEIINCNWITQKVTYLRPDGTQKELNLFFFMPQFTDLDAVRFVCGSFSCEWDYIMEEISRKSAEPSDYLKNCYQDLLIDYHGYGFLEYADIKLDPTIFGTDNADQYVSNAFPSFSADAADYHGCKPVFWKKRIPQCAATGKYPYLIRVQAVFSVKPGQTPFIQYKNRTPLHLTDAAFQNVKHHSLTFRDGRVVSSTLIFDPKTNQYYPVYRNFEGKPEYSSLTVTMTNKDYALLHEHYRVLRCEVLDGCYFKPALPK